jgi:TolA-binding protein
MTNYTNLILKYLLGELTDLEREHFELELQFNHQLQLEYNLQLKLDKFMKTSVLLEETEADPELGFADAQSKNDIEQYLGSLQKNSKNSSNRNINIEEYLKEKLQKAEIEMAVKGIDNVTGNWVKEWETKKKKAVNSPENIGIEAFITESMKQNNLPPARKKIIFGKWSVKQISAAFGAIAAIFIISLLIFNSLEPSLTESELFDKYYEPLTDNSFKIRGSDQEINKDFSKAVDFYLSSNYIEADSKFGQIREMGISSSELLLYSGLTKTATGDYPAAIQLFNSLLNDSDQFSPEAKWYLGLCYLKTGEPEKAKALMEDLIGQGFYLKKATIILKNLDR